MKLPIQAQPVMRNVTTADRMGASGNGITPSGCSTWTAIGCTAALAACAGICAASLGSGCVACFAGLGASSCFDCLT